jgi:ferredoxin
MIKIDKSKCLGCGLCTSICPESFEIDEEGKAKVISQKENSCVKDAIESCPVGAIVE